MTTNTAISLHFSFFQIKKSLFVFSFLLGIACSAQAQISYISDVKKTEQLAKMAAERFVEGEYKELFDELRKYWPLPPNEIDQLESQTIRYGNIFEERFGETVGYFKLKTEVIGDFARRETYLIRYGYTAIRFKITFYRHPKGWVVNGFTWDDSFSEEFE